MALVYDSRDEFTDDITTDDHGFRGYLSYFPEGGSATSIIDVYSKDVTDLVLSYTPSFRELGLNAIRATIGARDQGTENNYRAEMRAGRAGVNLTLPHRVPLWVGFSIFIPADWIPDNQFDVIFQTHSTTNSISGTSPGVGLYIQNSRFRVRHAGSSDGVTAINSDYHDIGRNVGANRWYDIAVYINTDYVAKRDSISMIYVDGELISTRTDVNGALQTDLSTPDPFYVNFGTYKSPWSNSGFSSTVSSREYIFSNFVIGDANSNLKEVSPPPRPALLDLVNYRVSGAVNDGLKAKYDAIAAGTTLNDLERAYLNSYLGVDGSLYTLNDMWMLALNNEGFTTGTLNDRLMEFWREGGGNFTF